MTSRFSLLLAATALTSVACSAPADGGGPPGPPGGGLPPPGIGQSGAGGTGAQLPVGAAGSAGAPVASAGAGGAPPVAAAGAGGAPAAGGAPGAGEIPIGMGLAITPDETGWVDGTTNGLGVQGSFFAASDATSAAGTPTATGSTITFDASTPGEICVDGSLAAIAPVAGSTTDFQYDVYWGGTVGLNLRQVIPPGAMAMPASPWPRTTPAGAVAGFNYTITSNGPPLPELRFTVDYVGKPAGATYCAPIPAGATGTTFASVVASCWMAGGTPLPAADLLTVQWSIIPVTAAATPFNFCISNVTAVVQ